MLLNKRNLRLIAGTVFAAAPIAALATPPWYVDWAHTVPYQQLAVRLYYSSQQSGTTRTQSLPYTQIAAGVGTRLELNVKFQELEKITPSATTRAFGDTVFGMKYRLFEDKRDTEIGIGYQYTMRTAGSGVGSNANGQTPYLMASITPGRFGFYGVIGETFPDKESLQEDAYAGILATYNLTGKLMLGSEIYGNTATAKGAREDLEFAGGFYYQDTPLRRWFARFGHSTEGYSDLNMTFGVQLMFDGHEKTKG